jgi:hypothetical protein
MGVFSDIQSFALKASPINVAGHITVGPAGVTLGPKTNALGAAYESGVDRFMGLSSKYRETMMKAGSFAPADHVTIDRKGITISPRRNGFAQMKDKIIDFLK